VTLLPLFIATISDMLGGFGFTFAVFVVVIGIMIFVHELGHFLVAKSLGIRVDVFSLGFGPRLFGFQRGETDYRISALPLGGYVKMAGENFDESLTGAPDEFLSRPKWQRFSVAVAGPAMNLVLAFVLGVIIFTSGVLVPKYSTEPAFIGGIIKDSPAEKAGLQVGDKLVKINNTPVPTWYDASLIIVTSPKQKLRLTIERGGTRLEKEVVANGVSTNDAGASEVGSIGIVPYEPVVVVESVQKDSPAEKADLQSGDRIVRAEYQNKVASNSNEIMDLIRQHPGLPITFTIERNHELLSKQIAPASTSSGGRIGIALGHVTVVEKYGVMAAVGKSIEHNRKITALVFRFLRSLITGRASMKNISGPIEIAKVSGEAAREGIKPLLQLMLLITLQLGIINLLPIPVLDGGVIFLLLFEGLIRRDLSVAAKEKIQYVGFIFLMLVMGFVIVNDLSKLPIFAKLFK
jgi:regulator of sigma E protease